MWELVPLAGIAWLIIGSITKSRERIAMMKMQAQQTPDQDVVRQLDALRQEISQLRDTCTQFDVSHDNALERLDQRMRLLESKNGAVLSTSGEPPRLQTVERR